MEYEDKLTISTPEGVELDFTLAGIGSRFIASMIDHTIQSLLVLAGIVLLMGADHLVPGATIEPQGGGPALAVAALTLYSFLIFFAYDVLFEVRSGGRTPGKRLTGLRVVRTEGRPVGFLTSATRNVLRVVDFLPAFYGVAMATIFATSRNQRLGDIAAGTIVVREETTSRAKRRRGRRRHRSGEAQVGVRAALATDHWDVSAVSAEDIATVRRFLERRGSLTASARAGLATGLAQRLGAKVAGAPADAEAEPFLEALSAAKARRAASS